MTVTQCAERAGYRHYIYLFLLGKDLRYSEKIHKTGFMVFNVILWKYRPIEDFNIQEEYGMSRTYKLTMNKVEQFKWNLMEQERSEASGN